MFPENKLSNTYFQLKLLSNQHKHPEVIVLATSVLNKNNVRLYKTFIPSFFNSIYIFLKVNFLYRKKDLDIFQPQTNDLFFIHKIIVTLIFSLQWEKFNTIQGDFSNKSLLNLLVSNDYSWILNQTSLQMLLISLKTGYGEGSVFGYTVYWIFMYSNLKFKKAFELGRKFLPKISSQTSEISNFCLLLYYFWLAPVKLSFEYSIIKISDLRLISENNGRSLIEGVSIIFLIFLKLNSGTDFNLILREFDYFRKREDNSAYLNEVSILTLNLIEEANRSNFNIEKYSYFTQSQVSLNFLIISFR